MPFGRLSFARTKREASIIEEATPADKPSCNCFTSKYRRPVIYAVYLLAALVILWQSRGLNPDSPTTGGYLLLCLRIFVIFTLVVAAGSLFYSLRDFYTRLHSEVYMPDDKPSTPQGDGGGGDVQDDDFEDFCRREGFPLPEHHEKTAMEKHF